MSELAGRVAVAHPTYATGNKIIEAECVGCGERIRAINGNLTLGWNRHIADVMEREVILRQIAKMGDEYHRVQRLLGLPT